jgi:hypothetical protein
VSTFTEIDIRAQRVTDQNGNTVNCPSFVRGRIIIVVIGDRLSPDVGGKQTLDISIAGKIAQKVAQSPGSAISSITSAHDATRLGSRPGRVLF